MKKYSHVDFVHIDIQGAEYEVLYNARVDLKKIKRIHIGTHSSEVEKNLRELFIELGWICKYDWPLNALSSTSYGDITFQDGVQTWINPFFASHQKDRG